MKIFTLTSLLPFLVSFSLFAQNGLKTEYYDGINFNKFIGYRIDSDINHYWEKVSPLARMNPHVCSIRWTGRLMSPKTANVSFFATVDDGVRVWIANDLIIDNWN